MSNIENFYRLNIQNVYGSVYTDTVVLDYNYGNTLMFASLVMSDTTTKDFTKNIRKSCNIYMPSIGRYLNNSGQKYDIIRKKMPSSDFNHVIITRRDVVEKVTDSNDRYDFAVYYRTEEEFFGKLYDKLYSLTSVPILEEWMPQLAIKLTANQFMRDLNCPTIHNPARIYAKRVVITKEQLASLVSNMLVSNEVNINGTTEKSDIIDCVDGLDSYLNIFGDTLAERIQNSFVPKYDPESNEFDQYVNNYDDSCYHHGIELYKAQKATIQAAVENLKVNDVTFVIGEMGCGKTALGSGITYAHYGKKVGMTNMVMCPSHLVFKWKKEIERLVPNSRAYIVKNIHDLIKLEPKIKAKVKLEHTYIIMSKENAKFSYEKRPAAIWSVSKKTFVCPCCGQKLTKKVKFGTGRRAIVEKVDFTETDMLTKMAYNTYCMNDKCKAELWAPLNKDEENPQWAKLGATGWIMFRHVDTIFNRLSQKSKLDKKEAELFSKIVDLKNAMDEGTAMKGLKAPRKYSIAKYIRERYKGKIDYFICDELHLFKGDTAQGQAMADIACASKKFIGLTGTLLNGYADGLFYILYRTLPRLMKKEGYEYSDEAEFMRDYGVIRKDSKIAFRNGRRGEKISGTEKRLPGVSPLVFTKFLLENSVFISLSDMDGGLPKYTEIPMPVDMDDQLKEAYTNLERELRDCVGGYREGGMKAMGAFLQTLSVYPDMPYNQPPVIHPDSGDILVEPPQLAKGLRNKEQALLDLVKQKLEEGEKVLVYYEWTNKTDIADKLTAMFKENDIKSAVLTSSVKAEEREAWIEKQLEKGNQVLMCNPKLVETGLDLLEYTTIVFYQVGYNIFTMRQASRRSWRLSQTKDIEVYFLYYKDTIQDKALSLMATKLQASMAIEGKFSEEGLRAMSNNEDLLTQIASSVVQGIEQTVQVQTFVSVEKKERERDTSRTRMSMASLLIQIPNIYKPAYCSAKPTSKAIKQIKPTTKKSVLLDFLNFNQHVGNLL